MNNEPVAWMGYRRHGETRVSVEKLDKDDIPLYIHPAKTLTEEEIYRLLADSIWAVGLNTDCLDEQNWADGITVARAILLKAQEK